MSTANKEAQKAIVGGTKKYVDKHADTISSGFNSPGHVAGVSKFADMNNMSVRNDDTRPISAQATRTYGPYYYASENPNKDGFWVSSSASNDPDRRFLLQMQHKWGGKWQPVPVAWPMANPPNAGDTVTIDDYAPGTLVYKNNGNGTCELLIADSADSKTWLKVT